MKLDDDFMAQCLKLSDTPTERLAITFKVSNRAILLSFIDIHSKPIYLFLDRKRTSQNDHFSAQHRQLRRPLHSAPFSHRTTDSVFRTSSFRINTISL